MIKGAFFLGGGGHVHITKFAFEESCLSNKKQQKLFAMGIVMFIYTLFMSIHAPIISRHGSKWGIRHGPYIRW